VAQTPALQAKSSEFNPQSHQKERKKAIKEIKGFGRKRVLLVQERPLWSGDI
jgi:hypothetical protein